MISSHSSHARHIQPCWMLKASATSVTGEPPEAGVVLLRSTALAAAGAAVQPARLAGVTAAPPEPEAVCPRMMSTDKISAAASPKSEYWPRRTSLILTRLVAGAVISNAAADADNVVGLVFVSAFATEEGEVLGEATATSKDAILGPSLVPHKYPTGDGTQTATEFSVDTAKFQEVFAADVPQHQAADMAATQRPISEVCFSDRSGPPAWKSLPSWAVVATGDKAAGTDLTRSMAERAGATITELDGSHVIMVSQPEAVADVIMTAVAAVDRATVHA